MKSASLSDGGARSFNMASNGGGAKREEKGRNIQVVVRCRPFSTQEHKSSHGVIDCDQNRKEVVVKTGGLNDKAAKKTYTYDMVFGPSAKQIDVYRSVVYPILDEVIMGYNCTVFAYGQTGTGKTFTMEGERSLDAQFTWEEDPLAGIIPRTLHQIFEKLTDNGTEFSIKVSLLEIYNEELFDLLSPTEDVSERLQLFDDPRNKRGVLVRGLEEVVVHNKNEVYHILERGSARRRTASTLMNSYSSRSHSVFSVTIHMKEITLDGEELVKIGKLNLVDLAGSENIGRSGAVDKRAREAGNINQSLLTLGRVITALVEKRPHVPYRESKLTRILQDSLGGRTKTSIIATVSPSSSNLEETLSTLEYASRAKNIMNKPEVNQKLTKRTLIREYTEEIERLKRDLACAREKNGVYLSSENYESMLTQITIHAESIAEYLEKIAVMEEELKKVTELFVDSNAKLEQCTVDLDEKQQRLEETSRDLQQTKEKLVQEEFICSELTSVHKALYNTAGQLLSTVDTSTSDVFGLHDKLDRKKKVEQHNMQIQQSFTQRVDGAFSNMQHCVQQYGVKHNDMLSKYSQALGGLIVMNEAVLKDSLTTMESFVGGVGSLVAEGVARCQEKVQQHKALCPQNKEILRQLLEEHQQDMEEVLAVETLTGLSVVKELGNTLKSSVEMQRALAQKVEEMKEMGVSLNGLVQELAGLQEASVQGLSALQTKHDKLKAQILQTQERQQLGMKQTIQCLQDQLNLLSLQTRQDFTDLHLASQDLASPALSLEESISSGCSSIVNKVSDQADLLCSTSSSLAASLHLTADDSEQVLGQMNDYCSNLHSSVSGLVERDRQWSLKVNEQIDSQTQKHLSMMETISAEVQALGQILETRCTEQRKNAEDELSSRQEEVNQAHTAVQKQTSLNKMILEQEQKELDDHMKMSHQLVHTFLTDELQQDVPTGATPQRREFVYPRQLHKSRSRSELLNSLRRQQEDLQAALKEEEEQREEDDKQNQTGADSLEDEMSNCNESEIFFDENLVFNESNRVPFFKKKGSKESKNRPNASENEVSSTPQNSRLPLRCVN